MYKIILAAMVSFFLISCSEKAELSDYIKKSEYQIDNGTISVTIDGTTTDGLKINETIVFNCDDVNRSYYYHLNDSIIQISIHRYNVIEDKSLNISITKENDMYMLTAINFTSVIEKPNNRILDLIIYAYDSGIKDSKVKIEEFDFTSGVFRGVGSYLHQGQQYPNYSEYNISLDFNIKLLEFVYDLYGKQTSDINTN